MLTLRLSIAAWLVFPLAVAGAQMRPSPRQRYYPRIDADRGYELKAKDIDELSPARIVIEEAKDLALDKSQLSRLDEIRKAFASDANRWADDIKHQQRILTANPPILKRPPEEKPVTHKDSVSRAKTDSSNRRKADEYLESQAAARRELTDVMLRIQTAYGATTTATLAILNDEQQAQIKRLLDDAANALTYRLREANIR